MNKFEILIATVPDREKAVVEIWYENRLIAEINQENDNLEIELYQRVMLGPVEFLVKHFIADNTVSLRSSLYLGCK